MSNDVQYDVFLSHASPDKPWVRTLEKELSELGLRVFLDEKDIQPADNFVLRISDALRESRYLALVLSENSVSRPWVIQEWTSYMACHGPLGRTIPLLLDEVEAPTILAATQGIDCRTRDVTQVALALANLVGRPQEIEKADLRRVSLGRHLVFCLEPHDDLLDVIWPSGLRHTVNLPWKTDAGFVNAFIDFMKLSQKAVDTDEERAELTRYARTVGEGLFKLLFPQSDDDDPSVRDHALRLEEALNPGQDLGTIIIRSDDEFVLSLPWELLCREGQFLIRDARLDLIRTTLTRVDPSLYLKGPQGELRLLVNVSAPAQSHLHYEVESYRIVRTLVDQRSVIHTELGTVDDLVITACRLDPPATGIHFSGHGNPGSLLFEDEFGDGMEVKTKTLIERLRKELPSGFPSFFYLASCHGNTLPDPKATRAGSTGSAAQLHKAGVAEVVGYFGPIQDSLSTAAEAAFYQAVAAGRPTRYAVRVARQALTRPSSEISSHCRIRGPGEAVDAIGSETQAPTPTQASSEIEQAYHCFPFAWARLTFYHRGPEHPLSLAVSQEVRTSEPEAPTRELTGFGRRKLLKTGFIGRRRELHSIRRGIRDGQRVFVFQGLGGLGKTTLAWNALPMLTEETKICVLWCHEAEEADDPLEQLTGQLLDFCRDLFGSQWEPVSQAVDRATGGNSLERFTQFLLVLLKNVQPLALYLDNLESLLIAPRRDEIMLDTPPDPGVFAKWRSPAVREFWHRLTESAEDAQDLYLVASCRYRNDDYADALMPVSPLPTAALYRMIAWFRWLRNLSPRTRLRLAERLHGHPRAVEFANDLMSKAWRETELDAASLEPKAEWDTLVEPVLPKVQKRLWDDLLLNQIWDVVLDEGSRRMLYRMTLLRQPWDRKLMEQLGEEDKPLSVAKATADYLTATSLLEETEYRDSQGRKLRIYMLHPSTAKFIRLRFGDAPDVRLATHCHVGTFLEGQAKDSPHIYTVIEAGWHLFQAEDYERSYVLLGSASGWLYTRGRAREGLAILLPFLAREPRSQLNRGQLGGILGSIGMCYFGLGNARKAAGYHEQALEIAREIGDWEVEGVALGNLGLVYAHLGEVRKAINYQDRALKIAREMSDRQREGNASANLGNAYIRLGEIREAIKCHKKALEIAREVGDRRQEGAVLASLGIAYAWQDKVQEAIGYYEQALEIAREEGDRRGEASVLGNLGIVCAQHGEVRKAISYYEQVLEIAREVGDRQGEGAALGNFGSAYARQGEVRKAISYFEQALAIGRQIEDPEIIEKAQQGLKKLKAE